MTKTQRDVPEPPDPDRPVIDETVEETPMSEAEGAEEILLETTE